VVYIANRVDNRQQRVERCAVIPLNSDHSVGERQGGASACNGFGCQLERLTQVNDRRSIEQLLLDVSKIEQHLKSLLW
jgi:hypothetical protein